MLKLKLPIDGLRRESVVQNRKRKHREEQQQNAKIVPPRSTKSGIDLVKKFLPTPSYSSGFE
jgi:hypothetical protein